MKLKITAMEHMILATISLEELADRIVEKMVLYGREFSKPMEKKEQGEYLSIQEASELVHLAVPRIYGLTHTREIPHLKKGRKLLFKRSELMEWMDEGRKLTRREIGEEAMEHYRNKRARNSIF